MCGLVSVAALGGTLLAPTASLLARASARMQARGPDSSGEWFSPCGRAAMGHRRLAIVDLSPAGNQPMHDISGRYAIVFNGEIYNYRELKRELQALGHAFATHSDTEVLLAAYARWGVGCLVRLRGMFAFVVWDAAEQRLFAARDAFGIKPLYIRQLNGQLWLASQVKALAALGGVLTRCPIARAGFLLWGHVPEPYTPLQEIRSLPAGHFIDWRVGQAHQPAPQRWFDLAGTLREAVDQAGSAPAGADGAALLAQAMRETVAAHRIADVPVGVFLSAGLDSSTLAALMCEAAGTAAPVRSVTLGFSEYLGTAADEVPLAEATARALHTGHVTDWVSRTDFDAEMGALFDAMDQPSVDGANTYFVSRATRRAGLKVAISGLGGDELFGGYPSFRQVPRLAAVPGWLQALGPAARRALAPWLGQGSRPKQAGLLEYSATFERAYLLRRALFMPWELAQHMPAEQAANALEQLATLPALRATHGRLPWAQAKVSAMEAAWYMRNQLLRDSDWASMAHGLELRVPLVDVPLWLAVMPLRVRASPVTKLDMARTPNHALPDGLLQRPKSGFAVPIAQWLAQADALQGGQARAIPGLRPWALRVYQRWFESMGA